MKTTTLSIFMTFLLILLIDINKGYSQDTLQNNEDILIQDKMETIAEQADYHIDYSTLIEELKYYKENPLDLNSASREDLESLGLLNDIQISSLLNHIKQNGNLIEIYELQSIDGFNLETIVRILPYVKIGNNKPEEPFFLKNIFKKSKQQINLLSQRTLEQSAGYSPTADSSKRYLGSPYKLYAKYSFTSYGISFGFTASKDAGAQFFQGSNAVPKNSLQYYKGFDFFSPKLFYKGKGIIKAIALGDYEIGFGQGLCLSSGLSFSKTPDVLQSRRLDKGLVPYTATNANAFMRGVATTIAYHNIEVTPFYSYHKLDATVTVTDSSTNAPSIFSSLGTSGYHRTYAEIAGKESVGLTMYGGHIAYKTNSLNIGLTSYHTQFDADYLRETKPYNLFDFSGNMNNNYSIDYSYFFKNYSFFGEEARSNNGAMAYLNGLLMSVDLRTTVTVLHRYYDKDYQALQSHGFGESSGTSNEEGIYIGISSNLNKYWTLSGYYDQFTFPWLKYLVDAPSSGYDCLAQLSYTPNKKVSMIFRYKFKLYQGNESGDITPIDYLVNIKQSGFRFNVQDKISSFVTIADRVEVSEYAKEGQTTYNGYLIAQSIKFNIPKTKFSWDIMYALFDTDSYYARIYSMGSDIPNSFSIPSYYYQGSAYTIMMKYQLIKRMDIWLRYSQIVYSNKQTISSGLDLINGNTKTDVSAELKFSF
jgi:hypothetical protein